MTSPDHYAALGLEPDASQRDIRRAYRRLMRQYHPDARPGDGGRRAREINAAHDILTNPLRKADYDRLRRLSEPIPDPVIRPVRTATVIEPIDLDPRAGMHAPGKEVPLPLAWLIILFACLLSVLAYGLWVNTG